MNRKVLTVQDISCFGQCSHYSGIADTFSLWSRDGYNAVSYTFHPQAVLADLFSEIFDRGSAKDYGALEKRRHKL